MPDTTDLPRPPTVLLAELNLNNNGENNYYVNYSDQVPANEEQQAASYINVTPPEDSKDSYYVNYRHRESEASIKPSTNESRNSTFSDIKKQPSTTKPSLSGKQGINQAIELGAFKLKQAVIQNTRKEIQNASSFAREPSVLAIIDMVRQPSNCDDENDEDDDW